MEEAQISREREHPLNEYTQQHIKNKKWERRMKNEKEKEISEWREGGQRKNSELRERLSDKEREN